MDFSTRSGAAKSGLHNALASQKLLLNDVQIDRHGFMNALPLETKYLEPAEHIEANIQMLTLRTMTSPLMYGKGLMDFNGRLSINTTRRQNELHICPRACHCLLNSL